MVTDPTDVTLASYEEGVEAYCARSPVTVVPAVASLLEAVIQRVPGGSVLELGSGPGREAAYLEGRGLTVERTDACLAFVDQPRGQGHAARVLDVRTGALGGPFDAVLANAVLLHLARDDFRRAVAACHAATREGGLLALTLKEGDGEAWSTAKLDAPRWFVYWRTGDLRDVLENVGWQILQVDRVTGRYEPWLHALCQRSRDSDDEDIGAAAGRARGAMTA